jgi:hypothetical protein
VARLEVAGTIGEILFRWFPDLQSLIRNAHVLSTLAPATPAVALQCLEHGVGGLRRTSCANAWWEMRGETS